MAVNFNISNLVFKYSNFNSIGSENGHIGSYKNILIKMNDERIPFLKNLIVCVTKTGLISQVNRLLKNTHKCNFSRFEYLSKTVKQS